MLASFKKKASAVGSMVSRSLDTLGISANHDIYVATSVSLLLTKIEECKTQSQLMLVLFGVVQSIFDTFDEYIDKRMSDSGYVELLKRRGYKGPSKRYNFLLYNCNYTHEIDPPATGVLGHDDNWSRTNDFVSKVDEFRRSMASYFMCASGQDIVPGTKDYNLNFRMKYGDHAFDTLIANFDAMPGFKELYSASNFNIPIGMDTPIHEIKWAPVAMTLCGCSWIDLMKRLKLPHPAGRDTNYKTIVSCLSMFFSENGAQVMNQLVSHGRPSMPLEFFPNYPRQLADVVQLHPLVQHLTPQELAFEEDIPDHELQAIDEVQKLVDSVVEERAKQCKICFQGYKPKSVSVLSQKRLSIGKGCGSAHGVAGARNPCIPGKSVCQSCIEQQLSSGMANSDKCAYCRTSNIQDLPGSTVMKRLTMALNIMRPKLMALNQKSKNVQMLLRYITLCHSPCAVFYPSYVMTAFRSMHMHRMEIAAILSKVRNIGTIIKRVNDLDEQIKALNVQEPIDDLDLEEESEEEEAQAASASASAARKRPRGGARNKTKRHQLKQQRHRHRNHAKSKRKPTK